MVHLLFSAVGAALSLAWERQLKKAKEAHRFIRNEIHSELEELDHLKNKYVKLLNKEALSSPEQDKADKKNI